MQYDKISCLNPFQLRFLMPEKYFLGEERGICGDWVQGITLPVIQIVFILFFFSAAYF